MITAKDVLKLIKDNDVKYADFRFTDPRGKWQHVTFDISMFEEDTFAEGEKKLSAAMAREGARKALATYDLHEKAIRKSETAAKSN